MANPEHLKRLMDAIAEGNLPKWNSWIEFEWHADLSGADLSNRKLDNIALFESDLRGTNFSGAKMVRGHLRASDFRGACFAGAGLGGADFGSADLRKADLSETILNGTNFAQANLSNADLRGAKLNETHFAQTILKGARLEECRHNGPCGLDHGTIASSWPLPLQFLRGCGLPDDYIGWLQSHLSGDPVRFYSLFISYSSADEEFATRLHADLQDNGVRCWFAPHDVQGGKKLHDQIDQAIRVYDRLLLILSESSMASNWVKTEVANARQKEVNEEKRVLFPIRLVDFDAIKEWRLFDADTGIDSAREVREYFIPDFTDWKNYDSYKMAFERLLRDLKAG